MTVGLRVALLRVALSIENCRSWIEWMPLICVAHEGLVVPRLLGFEECEIRTPQELR